MYLSKFDEKEPKVNLKMQGFQENSEYKWISMDEMFKYAKNGTQVLRKAIEFAKKHGILTEEGRYQAAMKKKHRKMKQKLIGLGKNKDFGGGKGHKRPKMSRSKSAPAGFGVLEEENEAINRKIKVKIVQKVDEKRKKRRKNRRKRAKNKAKSAYLGGSYSSRYPDYTGNGGGGDGGGGNDTGGDGGGGGGRWHNSRKHVSHDGPPG